MLLPIRTTAEFSGLVRGWREVYNLSQRDAAEVFGTQQSAISDWEDPTKGTQLSTAIMLAEVYGYEWVLVPKHLDDSEWLDPTAPCGGCERHKTDSRSSIQQLTNKIPQGVM